LLLDCRAAVGQRHSARVRVPCIGSSGRDQRMPGVDGVEVADAVPHLFRVAAEVTCRWIMSGSLPGALSPRGGARGAREQNDVADVAGGGEAGVVGVVDVLPVTVSRPV